jgi:hypothetical protein
MTDQTGWPDASKPGVPLNPEKSGWHWLSCRHLSNTPTPHEWVADDGYWVLGEGEEITDGYSYLGPCHTPAEVAAMLAEAERRGMERAAEISKSVARSGMRGLEADGAHQCVAAIRAALAQETHHG